MKNSLKTTPKCWKNNKSTQKCPRQSSMSRLTANNCIHLYVSFYLPVESYLSNYLFIAWLTMVITIINLYSVSQRERVVSVLWNVVRLRMSNHVFNIPVKGLRYSSNDTGKLVDLTTFRLLFISTLSFCRSITYRHSYRSGIQEGCLLGPR